MKKLIIDRIEGSYAVCEQEDNTMINVPKYKLPLYYKEGDCLILDAAGMYQKDNNITKKTDKRVRDKMNRLFQG